MKNENFDLSKHLMKEHDTINFFVKKDYSNQINLSSNQLEHEHLDQLFRQFVVKFDPKLASQYLYIKEITDKTALNYGLMPEQLLFSAGSDVAVAHAVNGLTLKNKSLVLQMPNYLGYRDYALLNNLKLFEIDFLNQTMATHVAALKQAVADSGPTVLVVANPNNFLGTCIPLTTIEDLAAFCSQHQSILVIDEAYCQYNTFNHLELIKRFSNVIIIRTYSKSHGLAGLRLATIMGNASLIRHIQKTGIEKTVSAVALHYFEFLQQNEKHISAIHQEIIAEREAFVAWIYQYFPTWQSFPSVTNFLTINVASTAQAKYIVDYLAKKRVIIKLLTAKKPLDALIRITIGSKPTMDSIKSLLKQTVEAMTDAI